MERPIFTAKALEAQRGQGSRENRQRRDTEAAGFRREIFWMAVPIDGDSGFSHKSYHYLRMEAT